MHDLLVAGAFLMMVLSPCLISMHTSANLDEDF
jgi:hypothetical protein